MAFAQQQATPPPAIYPESNKFYDSQVIRIEAETPGSTIEYTLETNGNTSARISYSSPFTIHGQTIVRAVAKAPNQAESQVSTRSFLKIQELDAWRFGEDIPLPNLQNQIDSVSANESGLVVLYTDGTLAPLDVPFGQTQPPSEGLDDIIQIATGHDFALALSKGGKVYAWGENDYGQTEVPQDLSNVVAIHASGDSALALRKDGTLVAWGGSPDLDPPAELTNVIATSIDGNLAYAILEDGSVRVWGYDSWKDQFLPSGFDNAIAFAFGNDFQLALHHDGSVTGKRRYGDNSPFTAALASWSDITAIATSYNTVFGLQSDGTLKHWPDTSSDKPDPRLNKVIAVNASYSTVTAQRHAQTQPHQLSIAYDATLGSVRKSKQKLSFQNSESLRLTAIPKAGYGFSRWQGDLDSEQNPINLEFSSDLNLEAIFQPILLPPESEFDDSNSFAESGTIEIRNPNAHGAVHYTLDGSKPTRFSPVYEAPIPYETTLKLRARCIGEGYASSLELIKNVVVVKLLGHGTVGNELLNFPAEANEAVAVAPARTFILALKADGTAFSWSDEPWHRSLSVNDVVSVEAGSGLCYALHSDGTVSIWNTNGTLLNVPEALTEIISIKAVADSLLALKVDGTVLAWEDFTRTPETVPDLPAPAIAIANGEQRKLALLANGQVLEWTDDGIQETPADLGSVIAIEAGRDFSAALQADGTVKLWGDYRYSGPSPNDIVAIRILETGGNALRANGDIIPLDNFYNPTPLQLNDGKPLAWMELGYSYTIAKAASPLGSRVIIEENLSSRDEEPHYSFYIPEGRHYLLQRSHDLVNWSTPPGYTFLTLSDGIPFTISPYDENGNEIFLRVLVP